MSSLYIISNRHLARYPLQDIARRIKGVEFFQLREKDLPGRELYKLAFEVREALGGDTKLLINDRVDVALAVDADGVHLGQESLTVKDARRLLGPGKIIGVSVHNPEEAMAAFRDGADYLLFGHVFPTDSKKGLAPRGLDELREIVQHVGIPVLALGGITPERVRACLEAGAWGVAVMSGVMSAVYPEEVVRRYRQELN